MAKSPSDEIARLDGEIAKARQDARDAYDETGRMFARMALASLHERRAAVLRGLQKQAEN